MNCTINPSDGQDLLDTILCVQSSAAGEHGPCGRALEGLLPWKVSPRPQLGR